MKKLFLLIAVVCVSVAAFAQTYSFTSADTALMLPASSYTITGATWSGGTATVTIPSLPSSGFYVGGTIPISGIVATGGAGGSYNGRVVMTNVNTGAKTVSYLVATNPGTYSSGGTISPQCEDRIENADGYLGSINGTIVIDAGCLGTSGQIGSFSLGNYHHLVFSGGASNSPYPNAWYITAPINIPVGGGFSCYGSNTTVLQYSGTGTPGQVNALFTFDGVQNTVSEHCSLMLGGSDQLYPNYSNNPTALIYLANGSGSATMANAFRDLRLYGQTGAVAGVNNPNIPFQYGILVEAKNVQPLYYNDFLDVTTQGFDRGVMIYGDDDATDAPSQYYQPNSNQFRNYTSLQNWVGTDIQNAVQNKFFGNHCGFSSDVNNPAQNNVCLHIGSGFSSNPYDTTKIPDRDGAGLNSFFDLTADNGTAGKALQLEANAVHNYLHYNEEAGYASTAVQNTQNDGPSTSAFNNLFKSPTFVAADWFGESSAYPYFRNAIEFGSSSQIPHASLFGEAVSNTQEFDQTANQGTGDGLTFTQFVPIYGAWDFQCQGASTDASSKCGLYYRPVQVSVGGGQSGGSDVTRSGAGCPSTAPCNVTVTTATAHNMQVGNHVVFTGTKSSCATSPFSSVSSPWTITAVTSTSFTFAQNAATETCGVLGGVAYIVDKGNPVETFDMNGMQNTPSIVKTDDRDGQTAAIGSTTLYTPSAAGEYCIDLQFWLTAGGTGTSLQGQLTYNNGDSSRLINIGAATSLGIHSANDQGNSVTHMCFWSGAGQAIQYNIQFNGVTVNPTYSSRVTLTKYR